MPPLERRLRYLLHDLCIDWGFCLPSADTNRIAQSQQISARMFAIEVMKAEGFGGSEGSEWANKIEMRFIEYFGSDEASTSDYQ